MFSNDPTLFPIVNNQNPKPKRQPKTFVFTNAYTPTPTPSDDENEESPTPKYSPRESSYRAGWNYSDVVMLNVGGKEFLTLQKTLKTSEYLYKRVIGQAKNEDVYFDENGNIFIDRDPFIFKIILQYLRDRTHGNMDVAISNLTTICSVNKISLQLIMIEAEFYVIQELIEKLANKVVLNEK